jgi:hypothetical protein
MDDWELYPVDLVDGALEFAVVRAGFAAVDDA